jgi:antitoxin component YwqK of YwqJK toxin-antitoxin module
MKTIILILTSLLFLTGCEKEVSVLQKRGGVAYEVNSKTPFTGKLVEEYANGQKKIEGNYKNGKPEGLETYWHKNGQKLREGNYKNGKPDGVHAWWHENGQKRSDTIWKDGHFIEYNGFP